MEASQPAGFWVRLVAQIIDAVIFMIPYWLLFGWGASAHSPSLFLMVAWTLVVMAYHAFFWSSSWQATVGKRVMGIYIADAATGGRMPLKQSVLRYLVIFLPGILISFTLPTDAADMTRIQAMQGVPHHELSEADQEFVEAKAGTFGTLSMLNGVYMLVIALMIGLTPQKTGLHDKVAKTRALRGRMDTKLSFK